MSDDDQAAAEKTYRAVGRFIFEFSQAEYTIRHYLAQEIGLDEEHFSALVESYDVALLCTVAKEVFNKSRANTNAAGIKDLINNFRALNDNRNRVVHGLWCRSRTEALFIMCRVATSNLAVLPIRPRHSKSSPTRHAAFALS
jgi:hypothetical protein